MKWAFLGDSYDAVKRMWGDMLADWAPLYAEPRFIPGNDLKQAFTRLTRIPMLQGEPAHPYSILNDPDTGIRLPGEQNQQEGRTHVTIETIAEQLRHGARCVVTFDQSDYRRSNLSLGEQHRMKLRFLSRKGGHGFYYVSHAPFLFAAPDAVALRQLRRILADAGLPDKRIEDHQGESEP